MICLHYAWKSALGFFLKSHGENELRKLCNGRFIRLLRLIDFYQVKISSILSVEALAKIQPKIVLISLSLENMA